MRIYLFFLLISLVTADDAILQFGKSLPDEYVLDFRYPLSPLQSFAIALSTYYYTGHTGQSSAPGSNSGKAHHYHEAQNHPKP